jgi:hypothetical protein
MEKVKGFFIQDSAANKGLKVLIVVTENGDKYVVAGQHHTPTYLQEYKTSPDVDAGYMNYPYKQGENKIEQEL